MHELSIVMSIVDMARDEAQRRGVRVEAVHLKVGPLSGVVAEALLSCYEIVCDNCQAERGLDSRPSPHPTVGVWRASHTGESGQRARRRQRGCGGGRMPASL